MERKLHRLPGPATGFLTLSRSKQGRVRRFCQPIKKLDAVTKVPDCRIEHLASLLPELTSSLLFHEVKRLSHTGHVRVVLDGRGIVTVGCADERARHWETKQEEIPNGTGTTRFSSADVR